MQHAHTTPRDYRTSPFTPAVAAWNAASPANLDGWTHVVHVGVHVYDLGLLTARAAELGWSREVMVSDGDDWEEWGEPMDTDVTRVMLRHTPGEDVYLDELARTDFLVPMTMPHQAGIVMGVTSLADFCAEERYWTLPTLRRGDRVRSGLDLT